MSHAPKNIYAVTFDSHIKKYDKTSAIQMHDPYVHTTQLIFSKLY